MAEPGPHQRRQCLGAVEHAHHVHLQHSAHVVARHGVHRREDPDSGVVDQHVHLVERLGQGGHRIGIGHIALSPLAAEQLCGGRGGLGVLIDGDDLVAVGRQAG